MGESMEAVYEAAQDAYLGALNLHLEDGAVRAAVDAVRPLLIAEGRRQAAEAIRDRRAFLDWKEIYAPRGDVLSGVGELYACYLDYRLEADDA